MRLVGPQVKWRCPLECQPGLPFNRINAWIWSERTHTRWTVIKNPSGKDLNEILGWVNKLGFQAEHEKDSGSLFSTSSSASPFLQLRIGFGERHIFYMLWISEIWNYPLWRCQIWHGVISWQSWTFIFRFFWLMLRNIAKHLPTTFLTELSWDFEFGEP